VVNNSIGSSLDFTGISAYTAQTGRQPFVIPNSVIDDGTGKYIPNTTVATVDANWRFWANTWNQAGSNYVNSADYWKIREIALTYEFPKNILDKTRIIQQASLSLSGRNLFIYSPHFTGADPEVSSLGTANSAQNIYQFSTPTSRSVMCTLKLTF